MPLLIDSIQQVAARKKAFEQRLFTTLDAMLIEFKGDTGHDICGLSVSIVTGYQIGPGERYRIGNIHAEVDTPLRG